MDNISLVLNESQHLKENHGINITILETFHKTDAFCSKHNSVRSPPPSFFCCKNMLLFSKFTLLYCLFQQRGAVLWEVTGLPVSAQKTFSKISLLLLISYSSAIAQRP